MNIIIDVTYLISGIYTNLCTFLCKKCDIGYYVINHGVYRRRTCYWLVFIVSISLLCKILNACQNKYPGLYLILSLMYVKKFTSFCQVLKKMHKKENWFLFLCHILVEGLMLLYIKICLSVDVCKVLFLIYSVD